MSTQQSAMVSRTTRQGIALIGAASLKKYPLAGRSTVSLIELIISHSYSSAQTRGTNNAAQQRVAANKPPPSRNQRAH
jgi:hypothetical protein